MAMKINNYDDNNNVDNNINDRCNKSDIYENDFHDCITAQTTSFINLFVTTYVRKNCFCKIICPKYCTAHIVIKPCVPTIVSQYTLLLITMLNGYRSCVCAFVYI